MGVNKAPSCPFLQQMYQVFKKKPAEGHTIFLFWPCVSQFVRGACGRIKLPSAWAWPIHNKRLWGVWPHRRINRQHYAGSGCLPLWRADDLLHLAHCDHACPTPAASEPNSGLPVDRSESAHLGLMKPFTSQFRYRFIGWQLDSNLFVYMSLLFFKFYLSVTI